MGTYLAVADKGAGLKRRNTKSELEPSTAKVPTLDQWSIAEQLCRIAQFSIGHTEEACVQRVPGGAAKSEMMTEIVSIPATSKSARIPSSLLSIVSGITVRDANHHR